LTDSEFARIRDYLKDYESALSSKIFLIDSASLNSFIETSELVHDADKSFESLMRAKLDDSTYVGNFDVWRLNHAGFNTIADIESGLTKYKQEILRAANLIASKGGNYSRGICIFYLVYAKLITQGDPGILADIFTEAANISAKQLKKTVSPDRNQALLRARKLINDYKQTK